MRNSSRFVAPVKKAINDEPLSIIIPAAGVGSRIKSYGPKSLLLVNNETILERQIRLLSSKYKSAEIIVVVGYEAERVVSSIKGVRFIENENYETTNVVRSIGLALRSVLNSRVLVVYGDLVFNDSLLHFPLDRSCILSSATQMNEKEVGFIRNENTVCNFSYDLDEKWCQVVYLQGFELELFRKICCKKDNVKLMTHEVLNTIIDANGTFVIHTPKNMKILEIDSLKDTERLPEFKGL